MQHRSRRPWLAIALVGFLLVLAGCGGDDDEDTTAEKEEALCIALGDLQLQVDAFHELTTTSSVGELRNRLDEVNEAWDDVQEAAQDVDEARTEDLENAKEDLDEAVDDLPDDAPIDEAQAEIQPELDAMREAHDALFSELECEQIVRPTETTEGSATEAETAAETSAAAEPTVTTAAAAAATQAPTETPVPPTETPQPTATTQPTATPEPSATPVPPTATEQPPTPTTAVSTPTPIEGDLAYEADWSTGPGDWSLGAGWSLTDGALVSDGTAATNLIVPHELPQANYAVEAEIQIQQEGAPACPATAGLMARATNQADDATVLEAGYIAAVCPTEWEIAAVPETDQPDGSMTLERLASGEHMLDNEPHVYRFEVNGNQLRFFIDGVFIGETTNDRYGDPGSAGIYLGGNYRITVRELKVFDLG